MATTSMPSRRARVRASIQVQTAADERPGVSPRIARPAAGSRLVRLVSHGSSRRHEPVSASRRQRSRRVRVSSIPSCPTGDGSAGSSAVAWAATSLTSHHDTQYSVATREYARHSASARASARRNRSLERRRGKISSLRSTNNR
jgi:hypothetical protein